MLYLALIFWTFADARRRIDDPLLVVCATLASFFPFVGTIVYLIVRPPEYLDDVRLRELEMTAAEARLASLDYSLCPHCDYEVQSDYLRCPSCMRKLKERCYSCSKPIDPAWRICPFCEAETSAPTPSSTRRRRRQTTDQSTVAAEAAKPEPGAEEAAPGRARRRVADDADTLPAMEKTLILVKPDAFARGLSGEIIARFERKGLKIIAAKHMAVSEDLAKQHYAEHTERPFFGELVSFITSGPIIALVFEGDDAIKAARQVIGATNPLEATTGSIRGDFAIAVGTNMVHGSDSPESGIREAGPVLPRALDTGNPSSHPDHPTCSPG